MFLYTIQQNQFVFEQIYDLFLSYNFKIMLVTMTLTFYGLNMQLYMKLIQMKRIIKLWINTSHVTFHYYQLYYKMYRNINTFENNIF
jgi:hypothetical protein